MALFIEEMSIYHLLFKIINILKQQHISVLLVEIYGKAY